MNEKQEKINEKLKERITQLEDEVRATKEKYYRAQDKCDDFEKVIGALRVEALNVVGQWEKAASDAQERADTKVLECSKAIEHYEKENLLLKEKAASLSKIVTELQENAHAAENEKSALTEENATLKQSGQEKSLCIKHYESLFVSMKEELTTAYEYLKKQQEKNSALESTVAQIVEKNNTLQAENEVVTSQAEKLIARVTDLKNASAKSERDYNSLESQLTSTTTALTNNDDAIKKAMMEIDSLATAKTELLEKLTKEQKQTLLLQDQINIYTNDINELKEGSCAQETLIEELRLEISRREEEIRTEKKLREDAETEFATIKECYSTLLVEANDLKQKSETESVLAQQRYEKLEVSHNESRVFHEQQYFSALDAISQLTNSSQVYQIRTFLSTEENERLRIVLGQEIEYKEFIKKSLDFLLKKSVEENSARQDTESQLSSLNKQITDYNNTITTLQTQLRNTSSILEEQKTCQAALELRHHELKATLRSERENTVTIERDNTWLKDQVESMRQELEDVDNLFNSNLVALREEKENFYAEIRSLRETVSTQKDQLQNADDRIASLEKVRAALESENIAQGNTLGIAELDLSNTQKDLKHLEFQFNQLQDAHRGNEAQVAELSEHLQKQEEHLRAKRKETELLRNKINQYAGQAEEFCGSLAVEKKRRIDAEEALTSTKDIVAKLKDGIEELKARCSKDAESIKSLLEEREGLMRDRDTIVERYNRLHDTLREIKKKASVRLAEELKAVVDLCTQQEADLEALRRENTVLKKSVSMFVTSAQPKAEVVFTERLNLTEGPVRHPKKRSAQPEK